jgi:hypothetical protein
MFFIGNDRNERAFCPDPLLPIFSSVAADSSVV